MVEDKIQKEMLLLMILLFWIDISHKKCLQKRNEYNLLKIIQKSSTNEEQPLPLVENK